MDTLTIQTGSDDRVGYQLDNMAESTWMHCDGGQALWHVALSSGLRLSIEAEYVDGGWQFKLSAPCIVGAALMQLNGEDV